MQGQMTLLEIHKPSACGRCGRSLEEVMADRIWRQMMETPHWYGRAADRPQTSSHQLLCCDPETNAP
jgi:hypothetical protein